jgi:ABC-2 type transport system permease protein
MIYRQLLAAQVRSQASYRTSFVLDLVSNAMSPIVDLLVIVALFRVTRSLAGFHAFEVITMYALTKTAFALADLLVGNVERIRDYVRAGTLDGVLVRPLSTLWQLIAMDFASRRVSRVAVALALLILAVTRVSIDWSVPRVLLLIVTLVAATVFFCSIFIVTATVAFFWIDSGEFANAFTYGGQTFTMYPINIYSGLFRAIFAFGLGFGFVVYYPALALFGRPDPLGLPSFVGWVSPLVAVAAAGLAAGVWRFGVRRYRSTGS